MVPLEDAEVAVVDLARVTYFDLTLLNELVRLKKRMSARRPASIIKLQNAPATFRRVCRIVDLELTFEFCEEPRQRDA